MARPLFTRAAYRARTSPRTGESAFSLTQGQTNLHIVAPERVPDLPKRMGETLHRLRSVLSSYLLLNPAFGESLVPVSVSEFAPELIRAMAGAAETCGVGPMAAVAGTIAEHVALPFLGETPDLLVENGGDCYLHSSKPRTVALLALPEEGARLGLTLTPEDFPCAVCASSARYGHSLSLGQGDLAVAKARDAALADAAATALCNRLDGPDGIKRALDFAASLECTGEKGGLDGVFLQAGGEMAVWGALELVAI